jgi:ribA/ribD-fused uncharacterized protein
MVTVIEFFEASAANGYLSNFFLAPIHFRGMLLPTSEHVYQGLKYDEASIWQRVALEPNPQRVADLVRGLPRSKPLEMQRLKAMRLAVALKFSQNESLATALTETYPANLVETNVRDEFWGTGPDGGGRNMLGIELERLRSYLMFLDR